MMTRLYAHIYVRAMLRLKIHRVCKYVCMTGERLNIHEETQTSIALAKSIPCKGCPSSHETFEDVQDGFFFFAGV